MPSESGRLVSSSPPGKVYGTRQTLKPRYACTHAQRRSAGAKLCFDVNFSERDARRDG